MIQRRAMHALIIEDEFMVAAQIEDLLHPLGFGSFDFVEREDDAIDAARLSCPDLIIADERITACSGIAAVRRISADRAIPVVFVTDYRDEVESVLPGAVIIGKPFSERTLRKPVRQAKTLLSESVARPAPATGTAR